MGPTLETPRLLLRPPHEEDLDGWAALMADEQASLCQAVVIRAAVPRHLARLELADIAPSIKVAPEAKIRPGVYGVERAA